MDSVSLAYLHPIDLSHGITPAEYERLATDHPLTWPSVHFDPLAHTWKRRRVRGEWEELCTTDVVNELAAEYFRSIEVPPPKPQEKRRWERVAN